VRLRSIGIVVIACSVATTARAADIKVTVERVPNAHGMVHVDICDEATFLTTNCPFDIVVPARRGRVTLTLPNLPPGRYAAVAYHDENANGDLDVNALGMPRERYGFSNDPPMLLGPPLFKDAAFDVKDKSVTLTIKLKR
jgi:uncharacterized protein (DUF2141 family)